jgi:4-hydroxy-3-methylbut-2-enyl diphosphate reductase
MDDAAQVIAALKERFPEIIGPKKDDICYATQNRQDAVKQLARTSEVVIVVGSRSSSNSNRLREVAELIGSRAYLVDQAEQIDPAWLAGASRVGVTAGASAPEILVQEVVDRLSAGDRSKVDQVDGAEENVTFALPRELQG